MYEEEFKTVEEARKRELEIKRKKSRTYNELLILKQEDRAARF